MTTATTAPGSKFDDADLMGHPWQIMVGPRGAAAGKVELKRRATGERIELTPEEALTASITAASGARDRIPLAGLIVHMFGAFERAVAGRYLRARKGERFVSIIAIFSLVGIALGVATLIVVTSVMSGFQTELVSRVLGVNGHVTIEAYRRPEDRQLPDAAATASAPSRASFGACRCWMARCC